MILDPLCHPFVRAANATETRDGTGTRLPVLSCHSRIALGDLTAVPSPAKQNASSHRRPLPIRCVKRRGLTTLGTVLSRPSPGRRITRPSPPSPQSTNAVRLW